MREFISIPYDSDEENLFANLNKQANEATLGQIFDRIRILIDNTGNVGLTGANLSDASSITANLSVAMSSQIIKNLKIDAQKPFSIILKHIILSGINGFKSGTDGF